MTEDSLLEFPCEIPVKVFGRNDSGFRQAVLTIMRSHFPDLADRDVSERTSKADSYLSMTVVVHAESREHIDAAYRELSAHEQIIMVL